MGDGFALQGMETSGSDNEVVKLEGYCLRQRPILATKCAYYLCLFVINKSLLLRLEIGEFSFQMYLPFKICQDVKVYDDFKIIF